MLSETLTWVRFHSNLRQNQDCAPGPRAPSGCAHSLTNRLHPVGVSLTYEVRFPEHAQFSPLSDENISLRYCLGYWLLKSTRTIPEPVMLLAHPHHHDNFICLRNRLACRRLICWVLKPGVMVAGWDGDLSQEHKGPGPVWPHPVCELFYTILLNSHLTKGFLFCVFF